MDSHGGVAETPFGLPLSGLEPVEALVGAEASADQAVFRIGVLVDSVMRPVNASGKPVYANLHAAGGVLGGSVRWVERSGEGIALGSAVAAAEAVLAGLGDSNSGS
jgi:glycerol-3-phosphate dehydrogenase subunit B